MKYKVYIKELIIITIILLSALSVYSQSHSITLKDTAFYYIEGERCYFKDSLEDGEWKLYYKSGFFKKYKNRNLILSGKFKNNLRQGLFEFYVKESWGSRDNRMSFKEYFIYKNDTCIESSCFYKNMRIINGIGFSTRDIEFIEEESKSSNYESLSIYWYSANKPELFTIFKLDTLKVFDNNYIVKARDVNFSYNLKYRIRYLHLEDSIYEQIVISVANKKIVEVALVDKFNNNGFPFHYKWKYKGEISFDINELLVEEEDGWLFIPVINNNIDNYSDDLGIGPVITYNNLKIVNGKKEIYNEEQKVIEIVYFENGKEVKHEKLKI